MRIHLDKIASITRNLNLGRWVTLSPEVEAREGAVIAGRIHGEKAVYNQLEDVHGRMSALHDGDIVVGALGHRNALQGYEGVLPTAVASGDRLHLLNLGGVMGHCVSHNPGVGAPFEVEVLGQVLVFPQFGNRLGQPAFIILEQPARGVYADLMAPLASAAQSARKRGAAVLWTVVDPKIWNYSGIHATTRARMFGSELHAVET